MKPGKTKRLVNKPLNFIVTLMALSCSTGRSESPWLPERHQLLFTPGYTYQTFDSFWAGQTKTPLPGGGDHVQHTGFLNFEYGLLEHLAADLTVGYVASSTKAFSPLGIAKSDDGLTDTLLGLRYRLLDESSIALAFVPTLTVRVGGIFEGTYDENFPLAAGRGASGVEASLLFGKQIWRSFGLYGDVGYRWRNHDVPQDLFGSAGVYAAYKSFILSTGYRHVQGLSGQNIGPLSVTFSNRKEVTQDLEASLGYTDKGGRYFQLFYAHTINGRNTGEKDTFGLSATFPISLGK